jgi:hypothetical protein
LKGLLENLQILDFCRFSKPGEMDQKKQEELVDALIEKRICASKAQARRMICAMP